MCVLGDRRVPQSIFTASGPFCVTCTYNEDKLPKNHCVSWAGTLNV